MAKHNNHNWRKVEAELFKKFKLHAISCDLKIWEAQTIMIEWFLKNYKKEK